jgi:hypothetical protein
MILLPPWDRIEHLSFFDMSPLASARTPSTWKVNPYPHFAIVACLVNSVGIGLSTSLFGISSLSLNISNLFQYKSQAQSNGWSEIQEQ